MNPNSQPTTEQRPAGSQFSLRGLFILLTAMSVMFAVLALVLRSPLHWLGALGVPVICLTIVGIIELARRVFPPPPRRRALPAGPIFVPPEIAERIKPNQREGQNPFADSQATPRNSPDYEIRDE